MEIRQFNYFMTVAKLGSFTKASQQLHVSQPALSKTIKAFESELNVELLDRSDRQVKLTDSGEIVYNHGLKIFDTLSSLTSNLEDNSSLKSGNIRIGLPSLIGIMFFPSMIKGFSSAYPYLTTELIEEGTHKVIRLVDEGEIDCGIVMLPVDETKFDVFQLTEDKLMLYLQKSHPLAQRSEVALTDIKNEPTILFTEDFTMHDRIIQECNNSGFKPNIAYQSAQWDFIKDMVENNLGVTFFPESLKRKINYDKITAVPITEPYIYWEVGLIVKKDRYRSHATRALIDYILENGL
ncbi:MAG: LysR family transcriptional regulator [Staphylococcus pseudoxylosus]|uniref:LysR family transcriptional regulator n=1 Tax=Staphylococcus pseudoxylosus TaxID=2282419 RepID=UPI0031F67423